MLFKCTLPGRARSKKNSKQLFKNNRTGKMFISSSNEFKKWATHMGLFVRQKKPATPIDFPVNLSVKVYLKNHAHEPDLDNVIASVVDLLEDNGVMVNDKLVYSLDGSKKIFGEEIERLEIEMTGL